MLGTLLKMNMKGFRDSKFTQPTWLAYQAQVNPESYTLDHKVLTDEELRQGTSGNAAAYVCTSPRTLSFECIFDSTGAIGDTPADLAGPAGVAGQLALFKNTVYTYFGESHRPPYVLLQWGTLIFPCQIQTLNVTYKLFSPDGVPLRATAKAVFQEVIEDTLLSRIENALSADLPHVRTEQAGDTLPLLCHEVYGDASLYPQVASANRLAGFRTLRVGQQLAFPPLVPAA